MNECNTGKGIRSAAGPITKTIAIGGTGKSLSTALGLR